MEMPAFNWIILPHMILLVPDVITAVAITEAAVAAITGVVVAVIIVCTIPREAIPTTEATPGGDLIHVTHNPSHLDDTTTGHDLTKDINPTHVARAGPNHQEEDTDIIPV